MLKAILVGALLCSGAMGSAAHAAELKLPPDADKGLYCHEVLIEVAKIMSKEGNPGAAQALRYYAQNWMAWVRTARSSDVNKVRAQYTAEAKKDVARKKYRYKDCCAVLN